MSAPAVSRYHLPSTEYFAPMRAAMPLATLAGYAEAERRARQYGPNLGNEIYGPFSGPHEYSPYGGGLAARINEDPSQSHFLTGRWNRALVASPATAILGLGSAAIGRDEVIRAEAADAIMQGKAKFFLETAGVSATPLCVRSYLTREQLDQLDHMDAGRRRDQARIWRALNFAETVKAIACNFGFINIEDAQGSDLPLIFGALECLKGECTIWSDDKQGTGVVVAAAFLAWVEMTDREMEDIRGVILGAGAGGMGVYDELLNHGCRPENIMVTDSGPKKDRSGRPYPLHEGRSDVDSDSYKVKMRQGIRPGTTVEEFARGADFIINLGVKETYTNYLAWTEQIVRGLAPRPLFGATTNPEQGVTPDMLWNVRDDAEYITGKQGYDGQVANNFTAFGQVGAGALMAMAVGVGPRMTVDAARGILKVAKQNPKFGPRWLLPDPREIELIEAEAGAVAKAAAREGLSLRVGANPTQAQLAQFDAQIDALVRARRSFVEERRKPAEEERRRRYLDMRFPESYAPFSLKDGKSPEYFIPPEMSREVFEHLAHRMAIKEERWQDLLLAGGGMDPKALTVVLERLKPATVGETEEAKTAFKELAIIVNISLIAPELGLALALRRTRVRAENLKDRPTVFHRRAVLEAVLEIVPEARKAIYSSLQGIPELDGSLGA